MFPVFFDTCTLYGSLLSDLLLRLAEVNLYTPYWSDRVLNELEEAVLRSAPGVNIVRRIALMNDTFPDACVSQYEHLIGSMSNDEGDRHVLAATCVSPAHTLVTFNVRHFSSESIGPYGIEVITPDDFLLDLYDIDPYRTMAVCMELIEDYQNPQYSFAEFIEALKRSHVPQFAAHIEQCLDTISVSSLL